LLEELIVTQLVKKYPAFFMEPKGSLPCSHKPANEPYPEPAKFSSSHPFLPKIHFNVIFPPTPRSTQWSFTFGKLVATISKTYFYTHKAASSPLFTDSNKRLYLRNIYQQ